MRIRLVGGAHDGLAVEMHDEQGIVYEVAEPPTIYTRARHVAGHWWIEERGDPGVKPTYIEQNLLHRMMVLW